MFFLGISLRDTEEEAKEFVAKYGWAFANGRDPDIAIARRYNVDSTPTTFLITKAGNFLLRKTGAVPEDQLQDALEKLLQQGK